MVVAAGMAWSLGGLFFRMVEDATVWQLVAYRTTFMWTTMGLWLLWRYRGDFVPKCLAIGRLGVFAALGITAANICYMFSLSMTWVANTSLILGASPMVTALIAWLLLREKVRGASFVGMGLVAAGIATMVWGGLGTGRVMGDVMALLSVVGFALFAVCVRAGNDRDMLPATALGMVFSSACGFSLALATGEVVAITTHDLMITAMMGVVQMTLGMALFVAGSKTVPAAQLAMLSLTEIIFGPIWVALIFDEIPVAETFVGGALVLAGVVFNALTGIRRKHPLPQVLGSPLEGLENRKTTPCTRWLVPGSVERPQDVVSARALFLDLRGCHGRRAIAPALPDEGRDRGDLVVVELPVEGGHGEPRRPVRGLRHGCTVEDRADHLLRALRCRRGVAR